MGNKSEWHYHEDAMEQCIVTYIGTLIDNMKKEGKTFNHLLSGSPHKASAHLPIPGTNIAIPFVVDIQFGKVAPTKEIVEQQKKIFPEEQFKTLEVK